MRTLSALLLLVALAIALSASARQAPTAALGPQGALFEQALAQAGLTPDDMRFDMGDRSFWGGDKYRLPFFDTFQADPWKLSPYARKLSELMLSQAGDPATLLVSAQSRLNTGIRMGLTGDPLTSYQARITNLGADSLAVALAELDQSVGISGAKTETYKLRDGSSAGYDALPPVVRDNAALVLFAMRDALAYRDEALTQPILALGHDPQSVFTQVVAATLGDEQNDDVHGQLSTTLLIERLLDTVDFQLLNTGSTLLALAAQRAAQNLKAEADKQPFPDMVWAAETKLGWVFITSRDRLRHDVERPLLNLALRGDDFNPDALGATDDYLHGASVSIDLSGNDTYGSAEERGRSAAAGIFGYGLMLDLAGDDTYYSTHMSQGFGLFGTGLLYDAAGDDSYTSITNAQGCGIYGTGVLVDAGGNDQYHSYQYSQGYGFTKGVGLLLDAGGDDSYDANDTDIRFGGPQTALHNTSMSQGMGNGRRGDYLDGHSWAGGVGMLLDGGGTDSYSCGTFGQGCSYWYGTGMLVDKGDGADSYRGIWYVQGSGAHFGLSVLQDEGGNDKYWASHNMAQGAGHDWTLSWFEDSAGDDDYTAPNLSLGGANANGIGVFWDKAGNDVYRSLGCTLGCAGGVGVPSLREFMLNIGVFVDGGGRDTYLEITKRDQENPALELETQPWDFAGDGKAWTRAGMTTPAIQQEYGVGVDAL